MAARLAVFADVAAEFIEEQPLVWAAWRLLVGSGVVLLVKALLVASTIAASSLLGSLVDGVAPREHPITEIPLSAGLERPEAEISGLAWYGEQLVILPQYPERLGHNVFVMERSAVEAWLDGRGTAPAPRAVPISATGLESVPGFEGFEAIAFHGDRVFVTVEIEDGGAEGRLIAGRVDGDLEGIELDVGTTARLSPQAELDNLAYEALAVTADRVMVFYETNGKNNAAPRVRAFDHDLRPLEDLGLAHLEYRITDVSEVEADGRLWAVNYFWPGEEWSPGACPLAARFGVGATHARAQYVERIVPLRIGDRGVEPAGEPLQLELDPEGARNWEGIVRLPGRGFLIVTDEHPSSMLAFVPARESVSSGRSP